MCGTDVEPLLTARLCTTPTEGDLKLRRHERGRIACRLLDQPRKVAAKTPAEQLERERIACHDRLQLDHLLVDDSHHLDHRTIGVVGSDHGRLQERRHLFVEAAEHRMRERAHAQAIVDRLIDHVWPQTALDKPDLRAIAKAVDLGDAKHLPRSQHVDDARIDEARVATGRCDSTADRATHTRNASQAQSLGSICRREVRDAASALAHGRCLQQW